MVILFYKSKVNRRALTFEIKMVLGNLEFMILASGGNMWEREEHKKL